MTTVATKDGTIAADSQATGDFVSYTDKVFKIGPDHYVGIAGSIFDALVFVDWLRDQSLPKAKRKGVRPPDLGNEQDFEALELNKGQLYLWNVSLRPLKLTDKAFAIGSGAGIAMGAMYAGATAEAAVGIASQLDDGTGGRIVAYKVKNYAKD